MKTRNILILISFIFITFTMIGQTRFDKFQDRENVKIVIVNQKAFELMSIIKTDSEEHDEYLELVKNLESLKVIITENVDVASEMKFEVSEYLKENILSELLKVRDGETNVKIYTKDGKDVSHISELFMFVEEPKNSIIIIIKGDIDLQKISELTQQLNIPHANKIKK